MGRWGGMAGQVRRNSRAGGDTGPYRCGETIVGADVLIGPRRLNAEMIKLIFPTKTPLGENGLGRKNDLSGVRADHIDAGACNLVFIC